MMRLILFLFLIGFVANAQQKPERFKLASNARNKYTPGIVLAKLKANLSGVDLSQLLKGHAAVRSAKPMVPEKQQAKLRSKVAPRTSPSSVDISLYVEIEFNGHDIESFINHLYTSDYFELIEPDYAATMAFDPSDPQQGSQYYLNKIKAYQAWDITQGSHQIIIGIVDSGGDLDHPDLSSQLYQNFKDPIDNVDNDNDGYVDNFRGWDFIGSDTLNVNISGFVGDNNPSNPNGGLGSHGTAVAGCAAAATNNSVGIAGVGFNSKLLFTKHSADNQGTGNGTIYRGYSGILYAATHGAKIINCSWGGFVFSQIQQDLISYVSEDLGCLVVAAAGNQNTGVSYYPASYEHVISVAASNQNDVRAKFSNFGKTVDLIAPGDNIFTTFFDNSYSQVDGTSFSAPITSGAAALVWAHNPGFTAKQVGEQIRVTADESVYAVNPASFAKKLGKGRLDIYRALTKSYPAIRATNPKLLNANGTVAEPGQDAFLSLNFTNHLAGSSAGLTINLTSTFPSTANVTKANISPGSIHAGATVNNSLNPFQLKLSNSLAQNTVLDFILSYTDGEYTDYEYISFLVNPSFLDVDDNQVITTLASNGRIGFEEASGQMNGVGFVFNDNSLLFEMGLIMGSSTNTSNLFDNVRATGNTYNQEFVVTQQIKEILPGERSYSEIFGSVTDNSATKSVLVNYRSLVWKEAPFDRFVILEYRVKNISGQPLPDFHLGLFADWDISDNGSKDVAEWDGQNNLGYIRPALTDDKPHAGISLLKGNAVQHYAIDNNQNTPGSPFGLYDGFTDAEKITAFSSGIGRTTAGTATGSGADVSHVVGAGPYSLAIDEEITIAFALLAAPTLADLRTAAKQADTVYNYTLTASKPIAHPVDVCYGSPASVGASGATVLKWYNSFTGGESFARGPFINTNNLFNDTIYYVSNAEETYESIRTTVPVRVMANPTILATGSGVICEGKAISLSVAEADHYLWSNGATTQSIEVAAAGNYSVEVETVNPDCYSESDNFSVVVNPKPSADFSIDGPLLALQPVTFANTSKGAVQYLWDFGNNQTSTVSSPSHTYGTVQEYTVTLTAINEFGCADTASETIQIITALTDVQTLIQVYPVPTSDALQVNHTLGNCAWHVADAIGKIHLSGEAYTENTLQINLNQLASGIYYLNLKGKSKSATLRFIKSDH